MWFDNPYYSTIDSYYCEVVQTYKFKIQVVESTTNLWRRCRGFVTVVYGIFRIVFSLI